MFPYLISATAELHQQELLRNAERARLVAAVRDRHALRHRMGQRLIRVGRRLADEPADRGAPVRAPARIA
jgi:hypothetical protein